MSSHVDWEDVLIAIVIVLVVLIIATFLTVIIWRGGEFGNMQKLARIHACQHARNVTDCLKLNTH